MTGQKPNTEAVTAEADRWVRNTRLFREWEKTKQDILEHKWYESEKVGYDIGWERASVDWMIRYGGRASRKPGIK